MQHHLVVIGWFHVEKKCNITIASQTHAKKTRYLIEIFSSLEIYPSSIRQGGGKKS